MILKYIVYGLLLAVTIYVIGRIFAKGFIHEMNNQFKTKYNHKLKKENNGTETEKK